MRKLIFFIGILLSSLAFSQIKRVEVEQCVEIGGLKPMGVRQIELKKCGNDKYIFTYQDIKYSHLTEYKSFSLQDKEGAFDYFYQEIIKGFENPPKEPIRLELTNDIIEIRFIKAFGVVNVEFQHWVNKNPEIIGISVPMDKKRLNKLFGKK